MRLITRYRHLSPAERGLFFQACVLLIAVRVGLRVLRFRKVQSWMEHFCKPSGRQRVLERRHIAQVAWAVEAASRRLPGTTCLSRAMAAHFLLGRLGQKSELRLGAALRPDGALDAHAWVEVAGRVIIGSAVEGFHGFVPFQKNIIPEPGFK
jgi:hypothetical protein